MKHQPQFVARVFIAATLIAFTPLASAAVALSEAHVFLGSDAKAFSFTIDTDGEYWLRLTDLSSPRLAVAFGNVSQGISPPLAEVVLSAAGPETLQNRFFATAGVYNASIFGLSAGPAFTGNLAVEVSTVPLPPAALLFAGSLAALLATGRRRQTA